jgi:hypothetical protein
MSGQSAAAADGIGTALDMAATSISTVAVVMPTRFSGEILPETSKAAP